MRSAGARILLFKESPEKLLDGAKVSVDRMPMLHVIFERVAAQCSDALRNLLPTPALFSLESLVTERIGEAFDRHYGKIVVGTVYVQAWEARLIIALNHGYVFALAGALFDGDGDVEQFSDERPLSNIELRLAEKAIDLIAKALQGALAAVCEATFKLDRIETKIDFVAIAPRTAFGVRANMKVRIMGKDISMFILIPQTALNSLRQNLEREPSSEQAVRDPRWSKQIQEEIGRSEVSVRGVIEDRQFTLTDIAGLHVGQLLLLRADANTKVKLECNLQPLFWCNLGQAEGFYTLRTEDFIEQEHDLFRNPHPAKQPYGLSYDVAAHSPQNRAG